MVTGYCVRCKEKREMNNSEFIVMGTSRGLKKFAKGTCSVCGTKMSRTLLKTAVSVEEDLK